MDLYRYILSINANTSYGRDHGQSNSEYALKNEDNLKIEDNLKNEDNMSSYITTIPGGVGE